jgi:hypothetical protein
LLLLFLLSCYFPHSPQIAIQTEKDKNRVPSDFSKCYKNTDEGWKSFAK